MLTTSSLLSFPILPVVYKRPGSQTCESQVAQGWMVYSGCWFCWELKDRMSAAASCSSQEQELAVLHCVTVCLSISVCVCVWAYASRQRTGQQAQVQQSPGVSLWWTQWARANMEGQAGKWRGIQPTPVEHLHCLPMTQITVYLCSITHRHTNTVKEYYCIIFTILLLCLFVF